MALTDLQNGSGNDEFQLQTDNLNSNPSAEVVSDLETLYENYYPRDARVTSLNIDRVMAVTWSLTTGSSGNVEVSVINVLG